MMESKLHVENLTISFHTVDGKVQAVRGINFDLQKGETLAKVMKTLVMYGEIFGAERMVPVTSRNGHLVTSFGLGVMKPVYALMDQLIEAGALSGQPFSVDPRPLDKNVPANFLQNIFFKVMEIQ